MVTLVITVVCTSGDKRALITYKLLNTYPKPVLSDPYCVHISILNI